MPMALHAALRSSDDGSPFRLQTSSVTSPSDTSIPPELGLPFIDAGIAGAVLAAKLRDQCARPMLLQDANNLFVCETVELHFLDLSMGQSLLQYG